MKTTQEMIAVMQAFDDGKKIDFKPLNASSWQQCREPLWDWTSYDYRIAPEPPKPETKPMDFDDRRKLVGRVLVKHKSRPPKVAALLTAVDSDNWSDFEYQHLDQPDGPWLPFTKTVNPT